MSAVPGIGVGVNVAVGSGVGVSIMRGRIGVSSATGPPDGPLGSTLSVLGGVGVGVGRSAKLPHASVGAPHIRATANNMRSLLRRLFPSPGEAIEALLFIKRNYIAFTSSALYLY
jgi:hypothetical protein